MKRIIVTVHDQKRRLFVHRIDYYEPGPSNTTAITMHGGYIFDCEEDIETIDLLIDRITKERAIGFEDLTFDEIMEPGKARGPVERDYSP